MSWTEQFFTRGSALCVGLDPVPDRVPAGLSVPEFCRTVVDLTADFAACYKPNAAFFERLGPEGMAGLARLVQEIRGRSIPVIVDAKRGDVATTAAAYAEAYFGGPFDCDGLTVNPSVGLDAVEPFAARAREHDRGVFLLLRTSNRGGAAFQRPVERILLDAIRSEPHFGAVVGATDPEAGVRLRGELPETLFLVPGFGAQGGTDLGAFFLADGRGAVVNASRSILYAGEGRPDWKDSVREAARAARETIERARNP
ncbi:MAG: orotidine-5'-phosphate decarboxylase [Planctomycetota bacterium]|jgi:orotidine-5'-phosphate decarboxylase